MTIKEIQEEIIDEFSFLEDWMERYEYIIELGKSLPMIEDEFKTDSNYQSNLHPIILPLFPNKVDTGVGFVPKTL